MPALGHRRRPDVTMLDVMRAGSRGHSRHSRPGGSSTVASFGVRSAWKQDRDRVRFLQPSRSAGQRHSPLSCCSCQAPQWPLAQNFKPGPRRSRSRLHSMWALSALGPAASGCCGGRVRWVAWRNGARSHALLHLTLSPGNLLPPKNCARPITAF